MRRFALALVALTGPVAACNALLPERFAVNVPVRGRLGVTNAPAEAESRTRIQVAEGFEIDIRASDIAGARFRRFTNGGDLLVRRPVDVAQGPDGAFYISADRAGTIDRVDYRGGRREPEADRP